MDDTDEQAEAPPAAWTTLDGPTKRERVISVAGELFAREGVDFPMPALAKALGVGVGTLYRQVGTKDDILAELVIERLTRFDAVYREAEKRDDPVEALMYVIDYTLAETMQDRIAKISFDLALGHEGVVEQRAVAAATLERLLEAAKAAGGVRADARVMDLRVMFRLAREAEKITPGGGARIAELVVTGLRHDA